MINDYVMEQIFQEYMLQRLPVWGNVIIFVFCYCGAHKYLRRNNQGASYEEERCNDCLSLFITIVMFLILKIIELVIFYTIRKQNLLMWEMPILPNLIEWFLVLFSVVMVEFVLLICARYYKRNHF